MALKYYYDLMSQPCRALYMFLRLNNIPYEDKVIALRKGEHKTEDYLSVHPFGLVPAIVDGDFRLTESLAIVDYLSSTRQVADHWYPQDVQRRAKVLEYLHWQHLNTRIQSAMLFQHLLLIPRMKGAPVDQDAVEKQRRAVQRVVRQLEQYFLRDTPFISSHTISVADVFAACELMQLNAVGEEALYEASPTVRAWMQRVQQHIGPLFDEAHQVVHRVRKVFKTLAPPTAKL